MRQKLGQHFLINAEVPQIIVGALRLAAGDTLIEVGPGHGELTQVLLAAIQENNLQDIKFVAVEKDPVLAAAVRERFSAHPCFEVVEADILKVLKGPGSKMLTANAYKIVGNIPYYVTGHLLRILSEMEVQPQLAALMLQKEVAERIAAAPPHMNRLAAAVQFWAEPKLLVMVPKEEFDPPPEVDSAVILLEAKKERGLTDKNAYYALVRRLFAQPRKTIFNNLREVFSARALDAKAAEVLLIECGVGAGLRPQDLSLSQIEKIAALL